MLMLACFVELIILLVRGPVFDEELLLEIQMKVDRSDLYGRGSLMIQSLPLIGYYGSCIIID